MKKSLAILLTLILTFSCFSILGIGTVSAETQKVGQAILESDFNDADGTNWQATPHQTVTFSDDNGDGVNDYASVKVGTKSGAGLVSSPFNLIPGNEYELTYYIRVPEESVSFKIGDIFYAPTTAFYQPKVNSTGTKVSSVPAVSTVEADNNYYAYSYTDDADETKSWVRREGFTSTWTIDGYAAKNKTAFSNFDYRDYKAVLSATNTDLNAAFANWTKVTVNFTAMAAVEGETSQVTALGFTFDSLKSSDKNYVFDLKDVKLVCTNDGTVTKTIMQSDFNNADGTNWQNTQNSVTYGDDNGDGVNDYARVTHTASAGKGLFSTPFNLVPGNEYELTYYIRVPKDSDSFDLSGTFFAPTTVFYQPKVNDEGTKVSNLPAANEDEAKNNYYAYSYTNKDDPTKNWARREGFAATWTIDGYAARNTTNFSNFDYRDYDAVLSATNADINAAFANWTKVTVNFTAVANTEDEKTQVAAVGFVFQYYTGNKNLVFDIKDVTLTETAAIEEEKPEEIVIPDTIPNYDPIPNAPTAPKGTIAISVSGGDNCHAFTTKTLAAEGEKVSVSASPKIGYKFIGWYEADELVTTEKHFTFNASVNRTLEARVELVTEENKRISIAPDLNYDGVVGLEDITSLAQNFAGWDSVKLNTARADVNGDSNTNLYDLVLAAQYVADWDGIQDKLASKEAYVLPEEDLTDSALADTVRAGESEYFNKSTIINEGNRALLVQLFKKAEKGEPITVASIGGSITQGVNDAGKDRSYGKLVSEWFEEKFGIVVTNINAGIGSTGSLVGVHRLESDVLSHNPDLVILEYSVNDMSSRDKFAYLETYEAIIRRVLEKDIALMTAVFGGTGKQYYTDYLSLHIHSALHYDLPVIDYYSSLFRYLDSGVIKWYDEENKEEGGITKDNLHPNFAGHKMISSAMNNYLEDVYAKYQADEVYETALTLPEESLFENADLYKTATFYASSEDLGYQLAEPIFNHNDAFVSKKTSSNKVGKGWVCNSGNGVIIFEFKGITSLTLLMMNNKEWTDGKFSISINDVTVVNNASVDTANNAVWPRYNRVFDKPRDVVIQITCHQGTVGVGPIGVTY